MAIIILYGSFYPFHEGHLDLLLAGKTYYEKTFNKVSCLVCPTHKSALNKKFGIQIPDDFRTDIIKRYIQQYDFISIDYDLISLDNNIGVGKHFKLLREKFNTTGTSVWQICGADTKVWNDYTLVIDDGRTENPIYKSNHDKQNIYKIYPPKLPISSSICRYIDKNNDIYPQSTIPNFDISWLTDSDIILGRGGQATIKLCWLGRKEVAVKIYNLAARNGSYQNEIKALHTVINSGISPIVYYMGEPFDKSRNIGLIIFDIKIPLQSIFPVEHSYDLIYPKYSELNIKKYICNIEDTIFFQKVKKIKQLTRDNSSNVYKHLIIAQLFELLDKLKQLKLYHMDIYYNNILIDISSDDKLITYLCDYGCSKNINDAIDRRGCLRYYPIYALDNLVYNYSCDEYMASFVIYELIECHEIYPECNGKIKEIINMRKNKIYPQFTKCDEFNKVIDKIKSIWTTFE